MRLFLLIGAVSLAFAALPLMAIAYGTAMGWGRADPTWAAALPFMLFYTVPLGAILAIVGWAIQFAYSMWG